MLQRQSCPHVLVPTSEGTPSHLIYVSIPHHPLPLSSLLTPFQPSTLLKVRISLKVANCTPDQLPADMYCRLRSLLLTADASVIQVWINVTQVKISLIQMQIRNVKLLPMNSSSDQPLLSFERRMIA